MSQIVSASEIYRWVDENGTTHFGEKQPTGSNATEISDKLKKESNIIEFKQIEKTDIYRPSAYEKPVTVEIDIKLMNYQLSDESRKRIQQQVKAIYQAYVDLFGWSRQPRRPIVIKIFGKYKDFEAYQINNANGHTTNRSHYSNVRKEVVMLGTEFTNATLGVLFHEVSHAILHMELRGTPTWINEGLAETFEYSTIKKGKMQLAYNGAWMEIMQHKLREGSLLSFGDYLSISNKEWRTESARVERSYYMIAWSMMRFLASSKTGIKTLHAVIHSGKVKPWWNGKSLPKRFADNYPGGLKKLDAHWRSWIRGLGE